MKRLETSSAKPGISKRDPEAFFLSESNVVSHNPIPLPSSPLKGEGLECGLRLEGKIEGASP